MKYFGVPLDQVGHTRGNLEHLSIVHQIGTPLAVYGFIAPMSFGQLYGIHLVPVIGQDGTALFHGFSWGYDGEGPRGLKSLLQELRWGPHLVDWVAQRDIKTGWGVVHDVSSGRWGVLYHGSLNHNYAAEGFEFSRFY